MSRGVGSVAESPKRRVLYTLREALVLLWTVADRYAKGRLLLALILVAGGALLAALAPIALKLVIDALAADNQAPTGLAPLALVALYVVCQYLFRSFAELRMLIFGQADQRVCHHVARRLFGHLVHLPMRFHLERKIGAIGETAEQGLWGYQLLLNHVVYTVLPVVIEFLTVVVVLVQFGHEILVMILGAAAVAYVFAFRSGAADIQEPAAAGSKAHIEAHAVLTDSLLNYETVKYFDAEPLMCNRYDQVLGRRESAWCRFFHLRAINGLLVVTIFAASLGASLVYAAQGVLRGTMTIGDFVLVNAYVVRIVQPLEMLGFAVRDIAQALAFLRNMLEVFREEIEESEQMSYASVLATESHGPDSSARTVRSANDSRRAAWCNSERLLLGVSGQLEFENVGFSYGRDTAVLRDVSFFVPAGRTVAVVGASGCGKSSLIRLLFRLYEPTSGRILLDGAPITEIPLSAVRQAIAVVPQDTVLFHDTIASNIDFGKCGSSRWEIEQAARVANLHEFILGLPDGYETVVGERGLKLSGGERQRVAIARAALKQPRIFVFDEATSSLDSRTEREILRNLLDVSSRRTTLVIAHRLSTVINADEILVLENGVIVERGTHESLLELDCFYAALWHAQQDRSSHKALDRSVG